MPPTPADLESSTAIGEHNTSAVRFPLTSFRPFLTLFSKFFASFPHGTCSLSVSHPYLALDGIYHLLELQSQATRLVEDAPYDSFRGRHGIVTLYDALFQGTWPRNLSGVASVDYNSAIYIDRRFPIWAVPASVALTEGILVSFFSSA